MPRSLIDSRGPAFHSGAQPRRHVIETASFIIFAGVLLAIPLFLGRSFYRALVTRRRIAAAVPAVAYAAARVIGYTARTSYAESDILDHVAVVTYQPPGKEEIWAETQPCHKDMYPLNTGVRVMYRPGRARSVQIVQRTDGTQGFITFEKNFEIVVSLLGIGILLAVALWYHGPALHILGPILAMLGAGYAWGHLTKGASTREDTEEARHYQEICDRLVAAQDKGHIPVHLVE